MTEPAKTVRLEIRGDVAIVTIGNEPVNALSNAVRRDLFGIIGAVRAHPALSAMILTGEGRAFVAGADIAELDLPPAEPTLPMVVEALEQLPVLTVAAINGACLGGGLEIAMACDVRISTADAMLGLPEARLGLVPGAGGTQRLPRLVGPRAALDMIASARLVKGREALDLGLVDAVEATPLDAALEGHGAMRKRRVSDLPCSVDEAGRFEAAVRSFRKKHRRSAAVLAAIDLVAEAAVLPFRDAVARERAAFLRLKDSDASKALRYAFLAERNTRAGIERQDFASIRSVGVVGGGTMGIGIALAFVTAGYRTRVIERDEGARDAARGRFADRIANLQARGRLSPDDASRAGDAVAFATEFSELAICDLVVEAVYEDPDVKKDALAAIAAQVSSDAVIASNTSYLDLDLLAQAVSNPARFVGLHFFAPADVMKLVEIVPASPTARKTVAMASGISQKLGKVPVLAGNRHGFIGNRVFSAYRRHMEYLLEDGADPDEIDAALEAYGFAMGPFAVFDLSGLDIAWAMRKRSASTRDPNERYVRIADRLCEAGDFGRKTGRGWYDYSGEDRPLNARAVEIIAEERAGRGGARKFRPEEIVARALAVMANEGAELLSEGVAASPSDIDVAMVNGYGFPRDKGGPLHAAQRTGLANVVAEMEQAIVAAGEAGSVAPLLRRLASEGKDFGTLPRRDIMAAIT